MKPLLSLSNALTDVVTRTLASTVACALALLAISQPASAQAVGQTLVNLPGTQKCGAFVDFATQRKVDPRYISGSHGKLAPFQTDGIVVLKEGQVVYEWYDGVMTQNSPHVLWSASKMITATLLARVIQEGLTYNGRPITLSSKLHEFFPEPGLLTKNPEMKSNYDRVTLGDLVEMSANFKWKEYYDDNLADSSFMPMLYTAAGRHDMAKFALEQPMNPEGPGEQWNYSGGNMNILMAVLQKIHAQNSNADVGELPRRLLFEPLGIDNAVIERDGTGHMIGSSYVYMTLRSMAKIGQLYLQNGAWEGKQLLPSQWTKEAQEITPPIFKKATSLDVVKKLGAQSKRIFWLNKPIYRDDGALTERSTGRKILYPQEMPEAPSDMYFAAGHYGQVIIVIPSEKLVIARTGYDATYWDHLQPLVVKASSCLNSNYTPNPVESLLPPSAGAKPTLLSPILNTISTVVSSVSAINYVKETGVAAANTAKELCSFLYVMNAADNLRPREFESAYKARSGLSAVARFALGSDLTVRVDHTTQTVKISQYGFIGSTSEHTLKNEFRSSLSATPGAGCNLEHTFRWQ